MDSNDPVPQSASCSRKQIAVGVAVGAMTSLLLLGLPLFQTIVFVGLGLMSLVIGALLHLLFAVVINGMLKSRYRCFARAYLYTAVGSIAVAAATLAIVVVDR